MVDTFVCSRNRRALEKLRLNRMTLVDSFRSLRGLDMRKTVAGLEDELAIIEAGIEKLNPPACPILDAQLIAINARANDPAGFVEDDGKWH